MIIKVLQKIYQHEAERQTRKASEWVGAERAQTYVPTPYDRNWREWRTPLDPCTLLPDPLPDRCVLGTYPDTPVTPAPTTAETRACITRTLGLAPDAPDEIIIREVQHLVDAVDTRIAERDHIESTLRERAADERTRAMRATARLRHLYHLSYMSPRFVQPR